MVRHTNTYAHTYRHRLRSTHSYQKSLLLKWTFMLDSVNGKLLYTSQVLIMQLCTRASPTEGWLHAGLHVGCLYPRGLAV